MYGLTVLYAIFTGTTSICGFLLADLGDEVLSSEPIALRHLKPVTVPRSCPFNFDLPLGAIGVLVWGTPVAQWIKRWANVLAVPVSSPATGEIFSTVNEVPLHKPFIIIRPSS